MIETYKKTVEENLEKYFDERLKNPEYKLFRDVAEYFQETMKLQSRQHALLKCSMRKV